MKPLRMIGLLFLLTTLLLINSCGGGGSDDPIPTSGTSTSFAASLDGAQETPPIITTPATGTGSFTLNAAKTELTFNITVNGLSGLVTFAHFHKGAAGTPGDPVRALTFAGNTATGTWTRTDSEPLTPALVTELEAGRIYVNVHTAQNPDGEIRGQVLKNP